MVAATQLSPVQFGDSRLPDRFWSKVSPCPMSGCWLWTAATTHNGYGKFKVGGRKGKMPLAHRVSYQTFVGPIVNGLVIDHLCRVRCCVNPAHLEAVTMDENRARGLKGALTTHCPRGHEYSDANTYRYGNTRTCRTCRREVHSPRQEAKRKEARNAAA